MPRCLTLREALHNVMAGASPERLRVMELDLFPLHSLFVYKTIKDDLALNVCEQLFAFKLSLYK